MREIALLESVAQRSAAHNSGIALDAPDYGATMGRTGALDERRDFPGDTRAAVDGILAGDDARRADEERIGAFLDAAANRSSRMGSALGMQILNFET